MNEKKTEFYLLFLFFLQLEFKKKVKIYKILNFWYNVEL